jgi:hypothetical protein
LNYLKELNMVWGIIIVVFGLLGWLGQAVTLFSPKVAAQLGLSESESDVDPAFWADVRGEALWDTLILWTLPAAGILLLVNNPWWAYFGLVGGGMYLYFAGRGILTRLAMRRRGVRSGMPEKLKGFLVFLSLWGSIGLITIMMAIGELSQRSL